MTFWNVFGHRHRHPVRPVPTPVPVPGPAPVPAPVACAVYRGSSHWGLDQFPAYERFLGRPVQYGLDYQSTDSWANYTWPDWQAGAWAASGRTVVLGSVGAFPGEWDRKIRTYSATGAATVVGDVGWAQAARGDYDAYWRLQGQRLIAGGQAYAVLRGAHEFNGGWFPHRVEPGEVGSFIAAWQRWVTILRSLPGQAFTFDWNPALGTQWPLYHAELAYPGDAYVDHVALDVYDNYYTRGWTAGGTGASAPPTQAEQDAVWNTIMNGERGLDFWHTFARAHGKHLSLPEWGIQVWTDKDGLIHGGGDNASFVERMASLIDDPGYQVDYHGFWEQPGAGVSDPDAGRTPAVPLARAAFLRHFAAAS